MKRIIPAIALAFLLTGVASCVKYNSGYIYHNFRLAGTAHWTEIILVQGIPPAHYDAPDSGALQLVPLNNPDSTNWYRLDGLAFDYESDVMYFKRSTGVTMDVYYANGVLTIPWSIPISGFGSSIEGRGTLKDGKLSITYTAMYRQNSKTATISSY